MHNLEDPKNALMKLKFDELVNLVGKFSETLNQMNSQLLSMRLKKSINNVPDNIEESLKESNRVERIKQLIKINSSLEECRDYLVLIRSYYLKNAEDLITKIDDITNILSSSYSFDNLFLN